MNIIRRVFRASLLATLTFGAIVFIPMFVLRSSADAALLGLGLPAVSALLLLAVFGWVAGVHVFVWSMLPGRKAAR